MVSDWSSDVCSSDLIKKAVVGVGHAGKQQVAAMIATLLPGVAIKGADADRKSVV